MSVILFGTILLRLGWVQGEENLAMKMGPWGFLYLIRRIAALIVPALSFAEIWDARARWEGRVSGDQR